MLGLNSHGLEGRWVLTKTRGRFSVKMSSVGCHILCCAKVGKLGNKITIGVPLLKLSSVDVPWGKLRREI